MSSKINVLFIHGIGNTGADYAEETIDKLKRKLRTTKDLFEFQSVHWAPVLDRRQNSYMDKAFAAGDLDWERLRREFIMGGLGDACAYLGTGKSGSPYYSAIQDKVREGFDKFSEKRPTVVIAHSMGCTVINDYLYDHGVRVHGVQCMIGFGSNLALFLLGRPQGSLGLAPIPRVYSLYDSDDLLAYPLGRIVPGWVTGEYRLRTGSLIGAHTGYWTDRQFIRWVSKCLIREWRNAYRGGA